MVVGLKRVSVRPYLKEMAEPLPRTVVLLNEVFPEASTRYAIWRSLDVNYGYGAGMAASRVAHNEFVTVSLMH